MFMRRYIIVLLMILFLNFDIVMATVYECTYKDEYGNQVVVSFDPIQRYRSDYQKAITALKSGNCKELTVKKYLINATSCNIQFYKYNGKIANMTCRGSNPETLTKLKEIARKDFGYID